MDSPFRYNKSTPNYPAHNYPVITLMIGCYPTDLAKTHSHADAFPNINWFWVGQPAPIILRLSLKRIKRTISTTCIHTYIYIHISDSVRHSNSNAVRDKKLSPIIWNTLAVALGWDSDSIPGGARSLGTIQVFTGGFLSTSLSEPRAEVR